MMWQRARILAHPRLIAGVEGREVWVRAEPPRVERIRVRDGSTGRGACYRVALTDTHGVLAAIEPDMVELLPEFRDAVPLIDFATWLREGEGA